MIIPPLFIVMAKLILICLILVFLKVMGRKTATLYFTGVLVLFFFNPNPYIAESVLKNTVILYFAYVFLYSLSKKTIFYKEEEQVKYPSKTRKQIEYYYSFFLAMFFYNSLFMVVLKNQRISFILSALLFFCIEVFLNRMGKNKTMKLLNKNKMLLYFLADMYFFIALNSIASLENSLVLLFAVFAFNVITDSFSIWCPTNQLRAGMIPAEFVIRTKEKFTRQNIPMFINSIFRQKMMNNYMNKKEVISPFRPITHQDIEKLKAGGIDTLKIQKTINLSVFVVLGLILSCFV
ncbi:MAG: hypothetical protein KAR87_03180 [Candidatus Aenigmarchaeota archaeon]|nr:hypothetical protein [Candidatus Aenigmarchaeota archaeon]